MMLDIFSSFDPGVNIVNASITNISTWLMVLMSTTLFILSMWSSPTNMMILLNSMMKLMNEQCSRTTGLNIKSFNSTITSLFIIILLINFMGLLPAVFSYSSHLLFTLSFGLPLWLALIMSSISFDVKTWAASLLPGGAPHWLNPFLVLIETISNNVRPFTLSFRLAANMSAGHIVLTLISIYCAVSMFSSLKELLIMVSLQMGYIMFEMGICLIQAYIYCLLMSLYADDHPKLMY